MYRATIPSPIRRLAAGLFAIASLAATPMLRLSETTIGPVSITVGQNGPSRSVEYTNAGDGTLNVTVQSSASWAVPTIGPGRPCSVLGTALCTPINVALNTSGLPAGTHTASISVQDPNALDAPQTITVVVIMGGAVPGNVTLYVSPDAGSTDSARFTTNSLIEGTANTASGGSWLSLAFQGNGSFAFVLPYAVVATNPGGLAVGDYTGTLAITGSRLADDNRTVNATMRVTGSPIASLGLSPVSLRAAPGAPAQVANIVVSNRGRGTLTLQAPGVAMASGQGWLTAEILPGTSVVQVRAAPGSLAAGTYTGTVTVNSNAANAALEVPVTFQVVARGNPVVAVGGVVNNATFTRNDPLGRGTIAAVFGEQFLFSDPVGATSLPLQTTMAGVRVLVNGEPAPVYYVSYGQINFQVPYNATLGTATVIVEADGRRSAGVTVPIANAAPRILRLGIENYGILVNTDGTFPVPANAGLGGAGRPARPGETLVMYAIGLGPVVPAVADGAGAPLSPLAIVDPMPSIALGATAEPVTPLFAGLTPGFVGLYQLNFTIPQHAETGARVPLYIDMSGNVFSNRVDIAIE